MSVFKCNDDNVYSIGSYLMEEIQASGNLKESALLQAIFDNPDYFLGKGLYFLRPWETNEKTKTAEYDQCSGMVTIDGEEYDLDVSDLEFDEINAIFTADIVKNDGSYIYLCWKIETEIEEEFIHAYPEDVENPIIM